MPEYFNSSKGEKLSISEVVREIIGYMMQVPERRYVVTIGTDSELMASKDADFVSAAVVRRVGNGARYFWRQGTLGKFHTLRDRMIREVLISLELAQELLLVLKERVPADLDWSFEVHADVGENGDTKAVLQEVTGMIRAHNFLAVTKPLSYAASNVADKHI